jgi:hypothetical protein
MRASHRRLTVRGGRMQALEPADTKEIGAPERPARGEPRDAVTLESKAMEPSLSPLTRRRLVSSAAATLAATLLAPVQPVTWPARFLEDANALEADVVRDTINALIAFITPGNDRYSRAQGTRVRGPGGIGAGATDSVLALLDFVASDSAGEPVATSGSVAAVLNAAAERVSPDAARGGFVSSFARLSFREKRKAYRHIETDPGLVSARGMLATLPVAVSAIVYSEAAVLDHDTGKLRGTPVGWRMSGYGGPADGRREFRGYWRGRRRAS